MVRVSLAAAVAFSVSLGGVTAAGAAELPLRKPGLWEIKIKLTGGVAPTAMMRHCTDETTDREMSTLFNPLAPQPCKQSAVQKQGDTYTIEATCRADDKSVSLSSDVSGDFVTSYKVVTDTRTRSDPDSEPAVSSMTLEGKYVGSCEPGQKPGDVMMAGGMKVNVKDIENFKKLQKR
jgi:hypothetical protein